MKLRVKDEVRFATVVFFTTSIGEALVALLCLIVLVYGSIYGIPTISELIN